MRFQHLSLERFGHFEGCALTFRPGAPDLHVIYGANEAGKTTSMAAVSDLLFGFEARSRYNFQFSNPLLRIGAVLEEDGRTLAIRRRKANAGSLVDAADQPLDDGPLIALLHGQTRDSFRLAFSLDHQRLREGGRAIVQAKDDVGQALFAAGSGLTGVTAALARIEEEADAIWGPRASQRRSYTQAQLTYKASRDAARDRQVRPKAWTDARDARDAAERARAGAAAERDRLVAEQQRLERIRRIAPAMQRRAGLLALLAAGQGVVLLAPPREERILAALDARAKAERDRSAAALLIAELEDRIASIATDPAIIDAAERIEALVERRGAIAKAQAEAARLSIDLSFKEQRIAELRRDLGMPVQDPPPRPAITRLRALARDYGEASASLRSYDAVEADWQAQRGVLEASLADATPVEGLAELASAVEAARRLGDDVDERCEAAAREAQAARGTVGHALARLAPWTGEADALARLPSLTEEEIAAADAEIARFRIAAETEGAELRRLAEAEARLVLDRAALAESGQAVSDADLRDARRVRDLQWQALRDALQGLVPLADPLGRSAAYEQAVTETDGLADRRFTFAEASARLALIDREMAELALRKAQADARRAAADTAAAASLTRWLERLRASGLPEVEPARLRGWLADRATALEAQRRAQQVLDEAIAQTARRRTAREALLARMPDVAIAGDGLAPVLQEGERRRAAGEQQDAEHRARQAELKQVTEALANQARHTRRHTEDRQRAEQAWQEIQAPLGLALAIAEGDTRLSLLDELRTTMDEAAALRSRLTGIEADSNLYEAELAALWAGLGLDRDGAPDLDQLRARLATARASASALAELEKDRGSKTEQMQAAAAARDAAMADLAPVLTELGGITVADLDGAVQNSRRMRADREALAAAEEEVVRGGDGQGLAVLEEQWRATDPDALAARVNALGLLIAEANAQVTATAEAAGDARRHFLSVDTAGGDAAGAAAEAEEARAEMAVQAEAYLLKRAQAVTLRWAIERYREQNQAPLLARAGALFHRLTLGRYAGLTIDYDGASPRLLGLRDDGRQAIDLDAMSDGTTDQLFLALRLAAAEQSAAAGVRLPFLADDLFINFDDARARAGFEVLCDLARTTQVLFFTHHTHLAEIARQVVGAEMHSESRLA